MKNIVFVLSLLFTSTIVNGQNFLDFDGADDYIQLPNGIAASSPDFTFEAWVLWDGGGFWERIFDFGDNPTINMFFTPRSLGDNLRFAITIGGAGMEEQLNGPILPSGSWQHVAVVLDQIAPGNVVGYLYLNGLLLDQNNGMTLDPTSLGSTVQNFIGKSQYPDPYLDGKMDEVRIWSTARSQTDIQDNMNNELNGSENGLVAYYNFNQGVCGGANPGETQLLDGTSGGNDGTLNLFALNGCASNWVCATTCMIPALMLEPAIAIPTLSQWGIIMLSILLLVFGVVAVRNKQAFLA